MPNWPARLIFEEWRYNGYNGNDADRAARLLAFDAFRGLRNGPASAGQHARAHRGASRSSPGGNRKDRPAASIFDGMDIDDDRADLPPFPRAGAAQLWLGHQPDQRFPRLRARWQPRPRADLAGLQGHQRQWAPAVKLSDNPRKTTGEAAEVARYLRVFGEGGRVERKVL
jgi:hypothetical protein